MNALMRADARLPLISWKDFDEMFRMFDKTPQNNANSFPPYRINYGENEVTITFALAGYPREALTVEASGNSLKVIGQKVEGEETGFAQRAFTKDFHDANHVWDFNKSTVSYKDGMLKIVAPKRDELKATILEINS